MSNVYMTKNVLRLTIGLFFCQSVCEGIEFVIGSSDTYLRYWYDLMSSTWIPLIYIGVLGLIGIPVFLLQLIQNNKAVMKN